VARYTPRVHVQDEKFPDRALCGLEWAKCRGGRIASTTEPPVVFDEESGSVNAASCQQCLLALRRKLGRGR
jgi:hypothetical protein